MDENEKPLAFTPLTAEDINIAGNYLTNTHDQIVTDEDEKYLERFIRTFG